jgi:hypothetical protein
MALPTMYYAGGTAYLAEFLDTPIFKLTGEPVTTHIRNLSGGFITWDGDDPFPLLIDPALCSYRYVDYPAATVNMGGSIAEGVRWTINEIKNKPGEVILAGYSQGACVAAGVYDAFRQGELAYRRKDLRAMVTFGSPVREAGHTFIGSSGYSGIFDINGSSRGGRGLFPNRLKDTEPFVYDFVMPGDVFTCVGDHPAGKLWTQAAGFLLSNNLILAAASVLSVLPSIFEAAGQVSIVNPYTGLTQMLSGGGHIMYPFFPPPNSDGSPGSGDTCYQIAARYINTVCQQIKEQNNPTVPAPTTPAGYQWFSSLASG